MVTNMSNLFTEFQGVLKGRVPHEDLLVPILIWLSGSEKNIEMCQRINKKFYNVNRKVLIVEVSLYNTLKHIIKYPKVPKDDEKLKFYYDDVCHFFDWTPKELQKNFSTIDDDYIKPIIAKAYGYDNKKRRSIKIGGIDYGRKKARKNIN